MPNFPILSVIVPVYGAEKYLKEALNSLINQTIYNIEIIAIDDGSLDNCPSIIDEYAQKDNRIIAIHKKNEGYGKACNIGLETAKGRYVAIFEPDDTVDKSMYESLISIAEANNVDIVKSSFYERTLIDGKYYIKEMEWNNKFNMPQKVFTIKEFPQLLQMHPSIWSCLYRREFLTENNIKFPEIPEAGWADNLFQVNSMCKASGIIYTPKAYYYWRRHHENPSYEIKDYKIPLMRSMEINSWLRDNYYTDTAILENLYKRELEYIKIVLGMPKISNIKDCYEKIKTLCHSMDSNIINSSYILSDRDKALYKTLSQKPENVRLYIQLKNIRRWVFSFKFSKNIKYLKLMGRYLFISFS